MSGTDIVKNWFDVFDNPRSIGQSNAGEYTSMHAAKSRADRIAKKLGLTSDGSVEEPKKRSTQPVSIGRRNDARRLVVIERS